MENVVNVVNRSVKRLGYCKLKKAQEDVMIGFMSGRDVFPYFRLVLAKLFLLRAYHLFSMI